MPDLSQLQDQLQNICHPAVKCALNLDDLPEAEPVDLGTGIDLTPWLSVRRIAPSTRLRQQVRRRGRRYMRFR